MIRLDLVGQRFGRLVVVARDANRYDKAYWKCRCDCGGTNSVSSGGLRNGQSASCGCLYAITRGFTNRSHGKTKTSEYRIWKNMITRCENPNRDYYHRYGGRGIKVCDRWRKSFPAFLADMGKRPSPKHMIERRDNDGDYCPENCCWATMEQQGQNTSKSRRITFNGETMSMNAWGRRLHISTTTIANRLREGLPISEVLRTSTLGGRRTPRA